MTLLVDDQVGNEGGLAIFQISHDRRFHIGLLFKNIHHSIKCVSQYFFQLLERLQILSFEGTFKLNSLVVSFKKFIIISWI